MERFMYEPMWTQELEDKVNASTTKPIIEELFFKYGLKVVGSKEIGIRKQGLREHVMVTEFALTLDGAVAFSAVSYEANGKTVYGVHTPRYAKSRAPDDWSRNTITSTRISNIIKIIDSDESLQMFDTLSIFNDRQQVERMAELWFNHGCGDLKWQRKSSHDLESINIEQILRVITKGLDLGDIDRESIRLSKVCLDKWETIDKNNQTIREIIKSVFCNDFYLLYVDTLDGVTICKLKVDESSLFVGDRLASGGRFNIEEVEPTIRVRNIEDYPDNETILSVTTMMKVLGDNSEHKHGVPTGKDCYFEGVNAVSYYNARQSLWGGAWLMIPSSQVK